eukprot:CAMPEP_0194590894 /NCGR_PEP_ID=MMETSP0292-20121207/21684_1 /TAXON_ID=39354 /ORGANISM="Heterosigma akashiwo, Strain CCMP2393" /LENGTH=34 /DNA_ID= /DNA_START= /DNA_END= /DNA_ORIENTATION=
MTEDAITLAGSDAGEMMLPSLSLKETERLMLCIG